MRDQSSADPDLATSLEENDDGVGDAHIVEFVGEQAIVGFCDIVTEVAVAAPQRATTFATV